MNTGDFWGCFTWVDIKFISEVSVFDWEFHPCSFGIFALFDDLFREFFFAVFCVVPFFILVEVNVVFEVLRGNVNIAVFDV